MSKRGNMLLVGGLLAALAFETPQSRTIQNYRGSEGFERTKRGGQMQKFRVKKPRNRKGRKV